jgi:hypothetical protein
MNGYDRPWDNMHHRSYFLPELARIEQDDFRSMLSEIVGHVVVPLDTHDIYAERNMASISPTITIDISCILGKVENAYIGVLRGPISFDSTIGTKPTLEAQLDFVAFDEWNCSPYILI